MLARIPNALTLGRVVGLPLLVFFMHQNFIPLSLFFFIILVLTDFLDGIVARKFNYKSEFGAKFDPVADKILILTSLFSIFFIFAEIKYYVWLVFIRDIAQLSSFPLLLIILKINFKVKPTIWAKLCTSLNYLVIGLFLGYKATEWIILEYVFKLILGLSVIAEFYILLNYFWQLHNIIRGKTDTFY